MLTPSPNNVICEPLYPPEYSGSLYIPEQNRHRVNQGIVKYVGKDVRYVSIGDHILFSGYTGTLIYVEGEGRLIVLPEEFINCIIHDDPVTVSGLYFVDKDGQYFPATFEQAIYLCGKAISATIEYPPGQYHDESQNKLSIEEYERK